MAGNENFALQPKLEAVEVPPNRALLKLFVFMLIALALGWIWVYLKGWAEPGTFAVVLILFGVCAAVIAAGLRPGASGLLLTPEGFVSRRLFKRSRRYGWDEVFAFRVVSSDEGPLRVGFDLVPGVQGILRTGNSRISFGADATLAAYLSSQPDELAAAMNLWRERFTTAAAPGSPASVHYLIAVGALASRART